MARPRSVTAAAIAAVVTMSVAGWGVPLAGTVAIAATATQPAALRATPSAAPLYKLTIIGGLPGPYSEAFALNNKGEVVGDFFGDHTPSSAFVWRPAGGGTSAVLPAVVPTASSFATDINDAGTVVGKNGGAYILWQNGTTTNLRTLPGFPGGGGGSIAINNAGTIAANAGPTGGVIWDGTSATPIPVASYPTQPTFPVSFPTALNEAGQTAGFSASLSGNRGFLATADSITTYGSMLGSRNGALARHVNDLGEVVGYELVPCPLTSKASQCMPDPVPCPSYLQCPNARVAHAFAFAGGPRLDLGTLDPITDLGNASSARSVNNKGQIVGTSGVGCCELYGHAVLWDRDGTIHDLNDLIGPGSGWLLSEAFDINSDGQIVGTAYQLPLSGDDHPHAFLLSPPCLPIPAEELLDASGLPDPAVANGLPDADGDAIPDCWETDGIRIRKANGDIVTVHLAGADPQHKDIYVEVDYMQGHRPLDGALSDVQAAFARAPVFNPDGRIGVDLHIELDDSETIDDVPNLAFPLPHDPSVFPVDFWTVKSGSDGTPCAGAFGTAPDRASADCGLILAAKRLVYHYALFGDSAFDETTGLPTTRGGISEFSGNDLAVTLGGWSAEGIADATGLRSLEARTFMHELGHNLGLDHGGDQVEPTRADAAHGHNCKPNYLSLMNYLYAERIAGLAPDQPLDYSRSVLPTLDQDRLSETAGIGDAGGWTVLYGVNGVIHKDIDGGAIDWNGDLTISTGPAEGRIDDFADISDCHPGSYVSGNVVVIPFVVPLDPSFVPPTSAFDILSNVTLTRVTLVGSELRLTLSGPPELPMIVIYRETGGLRSLCCGPMPNLQFKPQPRLPLRGYDDWAHLAFNFRNASPSSLRDGIGTVAHPNTPELTAEQVTALHNSVAPSDTAAPVTVATLTPTPTVAGWNRTDATVTLAATDETGGSGVKEIVVSASGAETRTATIAGAAASTTASAEGQTTVTFFARDNAGNAEAIKALIVRIDKTKPSISGARTPGANVAGWNSGDVTVAFTCSDVLSGVAFCSGPATLTTEGTNRSVNGSATDRAGNVETAAVTGINIDRTPPTTTTVQTPAPNTAGWNRGPVSVALAATDALSGVARTEFSLDGAPFAPYASPIIIGAEGTHRIQYRSVDRADNVAADKTLTVRIDTTAPEAGIQFDPVTRDLVVIGSDAGSGAMSGTIVPTTTAPVAGKGSDDNEQGNRERRVYLVSDLAGNQLVLVVDVKREGHEIKATVVSTSYNGGAAIVAPSNGIDIGWSLAGQDLRELEQKVEVGSGKTHDTIEAKFDAKRNETRIKTSAPGPGRRISWPGLVLVRVTTARGTLAAEF